MITFLRVRPAAEVTEVWATTRRREGTTTLEVDAMTEADRAGSLAGGVLPVESGPPHVGQPAAWVADPAHALGLAADGVPGWRITVRDEAPPEQPPIRRRSANA